MKDVREKIQATNVRTEFHIYSFNFYLSIWIISILIDEYIQGKGNTN